MLFKIRPMDFKPSFDVAGCFIEHNGEILLLRKNSNTFSVLAARVDPIEGLRNSMIKKLKESTSLTIHRDKLAYFDKVYIRLEEFDLIYHMFSISVDNKSDVVINDSEHQEYLWTTPKNALNLPLSEDERDCIKLFFHL